ncbi:hypothetical protein EXIGLDRAFT_26569 [Exidia glandulosa HHB12029]|uniref:Uncharacterized protein n=1 Tax=Exidia glandulosa HHB12029 TaxID=1314781 RepID=A0A165P7M9_EXIGL|nr:hypothetical protein EXIGLDRAFT_26569 [Exidia glandulosa HHB12029]
MTQHGLSIGTANGSASQTPTLVHSSPARVPLASVHQVSPRRERCDMQRRALGRRRKDTAHIGVARRDVEGRASSGEDGAPTPRNRVLRSCRESTRP